MEQENWSPNGSPAAQEDTINLRHYWHVVLERRWLIITAFVSVFVLSLIYLFKATPIYQATATIQINPEMENILRIEGLAVGRQEQDYLQTQYKNLMSRSLIQSVVSKLNLQDDPRYSNSVDTARAVSSDIQIAPIRLSRLVQVKAEHPNKLRAAQIANALATNFLDLNLLEKKQGSLDVVAKLEEEADKQKEKLLAVENRMQEYAKTNKTVSFEEGENIELQALKQYTDQYAKAHGEAEAAQTEVAKIDNYLTNGVRIEFLPYVANSVAIQELKKELATAEAELKGMEERYLTNYPTYTMAAQKIASLKNSIAEQANILVQSVRVKARLAGDTEQKIKEIRNQQEQELLTVRGLRIGYDGLKREAKINEQLFQQVVAKWKETDVTGRHKLNNIVVRDAAEIPNKPIKPRTLLTLFLGVVGGLGIALGLAFFVNYLDDSIKSQDDVETYLRLQFLGYIPNIKTNSVTERDMQSHLHPQSNAAEGFRTIRATISLTHKPDKFRVLAITSTIPSEGKSLVASNLAIVTAQTGLKTLLVDADLRRPSVHKAYQLHSPNGLASYLTEENNQLDSIIHKTEVPNLDVICCGSVPSTPSELIGSKKMVEFLEWVRGRYDRVLLDCPPISAVSDPLIISAMSDGIIFVTKFNKIRREHARKSVQRVQNAGIHIVGVVLNDIDFEGKDSYYYSYYYYQNRYYSSHYRTSGDRAKEKSDELAKIRNGD